MPPISLSRIGRSLPFSRFFRQAEQEMETVVKVLQPGPLGIIEHKFSAEEIDKANATVKRALNTARTLKLQMNPKVLDTRCSSGAATQAEQEMETVVKVLQPGPLGIIEHKFSAEEIDKANATVKRAVMNWKRNAIIERNRPILKDYIS
ncbi:hypothetical protein Tco_0558189 [Tanacetum coccineum]